MSHVLNTSRHHANRAAIETAAACCVALAVALGVGRFAFTPLLPLMLNGGSLDLQHGGWLASANYAGYLAGALSCAAIRFDHARMVRFALASTIVLTILMGFGHLFWLWAAIRFCAGVVSAWAFVFASQWGLRRLAELDVHGASGIIYAGPGVGIVVTGLLGAGAATLHVKAATVWIGFGLGSAVAAAFVWKFFSADIPRSHAARLAPEPSGGRAQALWLAVLYGLAGFGYIITATFLPVIARQALPGSPWPDFFWPVFGAALAVGAMIAARLPIHWSNRWLLAASYIVQAMGIVLGIVAPSVIGFAIGSLLIGLPFTAITLFAMREARKLRGDNAAGMMGYATGIYGMGQILGPLAAAPIAARTGSFTIALWMATAALLLGAAGLAAVEMRYRTK